LQSIGVVFIFLQLQIYKSFALLFYFFNFSTSKLNYILKQFLFSGKKEQFPFEILTADFSPSFKSPSYSIMLSFTSLNVLNLSSKTFKFSSSPLTIEGIL